MRKPRLILCGGVDLAGRDPLKDGVVTSRLATSGKDANVTLRLEDLASVFQQNLSPRVIDLLEIAAYVYAADSAARRGSTWDDGSLPEPWSRDFRFVIPVRDIGFWSQPQVTDLLSKTLRFISDDEFLFRFVPAPKDSSARYFDFGALQKWPFSDLERVVMFSGGLDSLAGAVDSVSRGENLILVSHRPDSIKDNHQRTLFQALSSRYSQKLLHVPVWVNKDQSIGREWTQRTRSFLFSSLGAAIAVSANARGVRFFENGVVSLNLPLADEVLRARASRTTHPESLKLFTDINSLVLERTCTVDNPFLLKTKTEVVSLLRDHGAADLIRHTVSCSHSFFKPKGQQHCGTCSQCIDRRISTIAANVAEHDPDCDYEVNVFTGPRSAGYQYKIGIDYVRFAVDLAGMTIQQLALRFNVEITRAVRHMSEGSPPSDVAYALMNMYKRHCDTVLAVVTEQLKASADILAKGKLDSTSLLAGVIGQEHQKSIWRRYATLIVDVLRSALPKACQTQEPTDEKHLQEICDALLNAGEVRLRREFPFMCWGSVLTKPDWYMENRDILVEMKYVRQKADVARTLAAIAEDITKYGDQGKRVLFIVYDPKTIVTDKEQFSEPVLRRADTMILEFVG